MHRGTVRTAWRVAPEPMRFHWLLVSLSSLATAETACSSSPQCTCPDRAIYVRVPDERASSVIDVAASGAACASAAPQCAARGASGACTVYRLAPTTDGVCHVDVDFSTGGPRFSADARVVQMGGCCAGLGTDPPSASDVDVPSVGDAGASGDAASVDGGGTG